MSTILLWSEYSRICMGILDTIKQIPGVRMVQIDSPEVRNAIMKSNKVRLTSVPCILEFNQGKLNQYEGENVMVWIRSRLPQQPQMAPQPPQQMAQQMYQQPPQQPPPSQLPPSDIKFSISAGPLADKKDEQGVPLQGGPPQSFVPPQGTQGPPLDGRTPISNVIPEPSTGSPVDYQQQTQALGQQSSQYYAGYQAPAPQDQSGNPKTPKEQQYQTILERARKEQELRDQEIQQTGKR